jgi:hypothetical protein
VHWKHPCDVACRDGLGQDDEPRVDRVRGRRTNGVCRPPAQRYIEQDDVGSPGAGEVDRFVTVTGHADNNESRRGFEQPA